MAEDMIRVLLVDDDEDAYLLTRDLLEEMQGYRADLTWAETYEAGLEALGRGGYDAALVDYRLGARTGLDLMRAATTADCATPIILLTGQGDRAVDVAAMEAGAADYVVKGQGAAPLERALRYAVKQARLRETLRASEEHFRALSEHASDLVRIVDAAGIIRYASPSHQRLLGYAPGDLLGHPIFGFMHPDDAPASQAQAGAQGRDSGAVTMYTFRIRHADGSWRWQEAISSNHLDDPAIQGFVVNGRDITARRQTEEALRASEASLAEAQRLTHVGDWWRDVATGEAHWSDELCRIHGFAPGEVDLTDRLPALTHPDDRARVRAWMDAVRAGQGEPRIEHRIVRPDGTVRHVQHQIKVVRGDEGGRPRRLVGVVQDITARVQAVEALRTSERDHRALMEQAADAIFVLDHEGRFLDVNARACALLGYGRDDLLRFSIPDVMDPTDLAATPVRFAAIRAGTTVVNERRMRRQDGALVPVEISAKALADGRMQAIARDITERKRAETDLRASAAALAAAQELVHLGSWEQDLASGELRWSDEAYRLLDYAPGAVVPSSERYRAAIHPDDRAHVLAAIGVTRATGAPSSFSQRVVGPDGAIRVLESEARLLRDAAGAPLRLMGTSLDVTERARAEEALRASEARLGLQYAAVAILSASTTLDAAMPDLLQAVGTRTDWTLGAFWQVDAADAGLSCAHTWHAASDALAGFAAVSRRTHLAWGVGLPGRVWASRAPAGVPDVVADANFPRAAAAAAAGLHAAVCVPILAGGAVYGVMEFFSPDTRSPRPEMVQALVAIGTHIGQFVERARAEEAVRHQATHDALTDLPNRAFLHERVIATLDAAAPSARSLALLLLDLDHFKEVNDTFGHEQGDALLREVAARLRGAVRVGDTVARLGGDEFAVLLPGADAAGATRVVADLHAALDTPLQVEGQALRVGASVGIALGPVHGADGPTLLRRADVAMYVAKRARTGHAVYDPAQDQHSPARLALVGELRAAIEQGALTLHYQPQVDLGNGRVCGVESLVRWPHPERGLIPPDAFIPLAEQTGLIAPLTEWVLGEAMRQARAWQRAGLLLAVSVNLSMWNLHDPTLPDRVAALLREHGLSPAWLRLELTESALMADAERALAVLTRLAALGVGLAVDDFGAGYSSLAYLKKLPVNELKIDKGFVRELATDATDAAIVTSTVALGHALGLRVVAEGIEDRATWEALVGMGCDTAQGYYLSRPLPADALAQWLRDSAWAVATGDAPGRVEPPLAARHGGPPLPRNPRADGGTPARGPLVAVGPSTRRTPRRYPPI